MRIQTALDDGILSTYQLDNWAKSHNATTERVYQSEKIFYYRRNTKRGFWLTLTLAIISSLLYVNFSGTLSGSIAIVAITLFTLCAIGAFLVYSISTKAEADLHLKLWSDLAQIRELLNVTQGSSITQGRLSDWAIQRLTVLASKRNLFKKVMRYEICNNDAREMLDQETRIILGKIQEIYRLASRFIELPSIEYFLALKEENKIIPLAGVGATK